VIYYDRFDRVAIEIVRELPGKGGLSTKIHALVDALGNPLRFLLTPGQAHDLTGADALLPQIAAEVLIADKARQAPRVNRRRL
jgi:Transposase DDE domain